MRLPLLGSTVLEIGSLVPAFAHAQAFGGAALFEPTIDIVESGILLDAQATVSADRKYVTLTMRPQQSQLLALRTFNFQSGGGQVQLPQGNVGGAGAGIGGAAGGVIPQRVNAPMKAVAGNGAAILKQRGITPIVLND
jgi:hypothetical protein